MAESDDLALWCALNQLMANYWGDVDEDAGRGAHEIEAFYARRRHGTVLTRHVLSNLRTIGEDGRHARVLGIMSLYRADGKSPFQGARPPAMIADFEARCVRGDDRRWRFQSHVLRPFIIGNDLPASIMIRPQSL